MNGEDYALAIMRTLMGKLGLARHRILGCKPMQSMSAQGGGWVGPDEAGWVL